MVGRLIQIAKSAYRYPLILQDEGVMRDERASLAKAVCTVNTVGDARELLGGNGILLENQDASLPMRYLFP